LNFRRVDGWYLVESGILCGIQCRNWKVYVRCHRPCRTGNKNNAPFGKGGAFERKEGCTPGAGVLARASVVALGAFPLMLARGTAVGLVERSETDRVTEDAAAVPSGTEVEDEATGLLGDEAANT